MIRPTGVGDGTRLQQIVRFIENSEAAKAGIEGKALKWADRIVPYHFLLAGLVWLVTRDFARMASVLMVDFSCALRLATPLAILTAMRTGTQRGVVVKGGKYLEALAEVDTVVFPGRPARFRRSPSSRRLSRRALPASRRPRRRARRGSQGPRPHDRSARREDRLRCGPRDRLLRRRGARGVGLSPLRGGRRRDFGRNRARGGRTPRPRRKIDSLSRFSGSRIRSAKRRNPSSRHFTSAASRKSGC